MDLKCGYAVSGGVMGGALFGMIVGALVVNASIGYILLLLIAWGLALWMTVRTIMADARHDEELLHQNADAFGGEEELPHLYWEGYDRGYDEALETMAYTRRPRVRPPEETAKRCLICQRPCGRMPAP